MLLTSDNRCGLPSFGEILWGGETTWISKSCSYSLSYRKRNTYYTAVHQRQWGFTPFGQGEKDTNMRRTQRYWTFVSCDWTVKSWLCVQFKPDTNFTVSATGTGKGSVSVSYRLSSHGYRFNSRSTDDLLLCMALQKPPRTFSVPSMHCVREWKVIVNEIKY